MVSIKLGFLINPLRLLMEAGSGPIRYTFSYISKFYFERLPVKATLRWKFQQDARIVELQSHRDAVHS
jgi:hypothetical protein